MKTIQGFSPSIYEEISLITFGQCNVDFLTPSENDNTIKMCSTKKKTQIRQVNSDFQSFEAFMKYCFSKFF